jgi:hypothetical protein
MQEDTQRVRKSTYFPGDDSIYRVVSRKLRGTYTLGPVYWKNSRPIDYQFGMTESGKDGELAIQTAERGLMEELGLMFLPDQTFETVEHSYSTKTRVVNCTLFYVKADQVRAIKTPRDCEHHVDRFSDRDSKSNKVHVIIYGEEDQILSLIKSIVFKPVDDRGEYYDKDILGMAYFQV